MALNLGVKDSKVLRQEEIQVEGAGLNLKARGVAMSMHPAMLTRVKTCKKYMGRLSVGPL